MTDTFSVPSYENLDLKNQQESKIITINGVDIEVFQYLPILEKYKLINLTLAQSLENNVYHPLKVEVFFNLQLVFNYTTLDFSVEDMLDPYDLFDKMEQNDVFNQVIKVIPETEYKFLLNNLATTMEKNTRYIESVAASLDVLFEKLPKIAEGMDELKQNIKSGNLNAKDVTGLAEQLGFSFTDIVDGTKQTEKTVTNNNNNK